MKSILTLIFLFTLINVGYTQQESEEYLNLKNKYYYREGYIVDNDSVKIKGLIKIKHEYKLSEIVLFVSLDGEVIKYRPDDIKGFSYSIYKFFSDGTNFYHCQYTGRKMSLYSLTKREYSQVGNTGMYASSIESFYVKRSGDSEYTLVKKGRFKRDFSAYLSDCDKVAQKILNKEYKYKDIKRIVREYNFCE
ncbi:hypothetical protein LVD15_13835 [Fulvivirga maritima]|uniref:hypothetical protein n=1 Tax=Fulvivirga maritima TaxID=2904247 RepID=UPI001F2CE75D|nr:hypothetical protein [Fulvivirga maritima]UII24403.1 hypothetical protein LVD15_13835 [Fulvivirga maritima]